MVGLLRGERTSPKAWFWEGGNLAQYIEEDEASDFRIKSDLRFSTSLRIESDVECASLA